MSGTTKQVDRAALSVSCDSVLLFSKCLHINAEPLCAERGPSRATPAVVAILFPGVSHFSPLAGLVSTVRFWIAAKLLCTKRDSSATTSAVVALLLPGLAHLPRPARLVSALDRGRLWLSSDHSGEHHSLPSLSSPGGHRAGLLGDWGTEPLGAAREEIVSTPAPVTLLLPRLSRLPG